MSPARQLIREAARQHIRFRIGPKGLELFGDLRSYPGEMALYAFAWRSRPMASAIEAYVKGENERGDRFLASLRKRIETL